MALEEIKERIKELMELSQKPVKRRGAGVQRRIKKDYKDKVNEKKQKVLELIRGPDDLTIAEMAKRARVDRKIVKEVVLQHQVFGHINTFSY